LHAYPVKTDTHYIWVNDAPFRHPPQSAGHDPKRTFVPSN